MQHITDQGIHFNPVYQGGCFENCVNLGVNLDGPYVLEVEGHGLDGLGWLLAGLGGLFGILHVKHLAPSFWNFSLLPVANDIGCNTNGSGEVAYAFFGADCYV